MENDEELLKAHTEKQEGICEYCQKEPSYDYLCQKWVDHCLVPCPTCGELYPKCCEEKHKRGH